MSLFPPLCGSFPVNLPGESFTYSDGAVSLKLHAIADCNQHFKYAYRTGTIFLSALRAIYVDGSQMNAIAPASFGIPLAFITRMELRQPLFRCKYVVGYVRCVPGQGLSGFARFKFKFSSSESAHRFFCVFRQLVAAAQQRGDPMGIFQQTHHVSTSVMIPPYGSQASFITTTATYNQACFMPSHVAPGSVLVTGPPVHDPTQRRASACPVYWSSQHQHQYQHQPMPSPPVHSSQTTEGTAYIDPAHPGMIFLQTSPKEHAPPMVRTVESRRSTCHL